MSHNNLQLNFLPDLLKFAGSRVLRSQEATDPIRNCPVPTGAQKYSTSPRFSGVLPWREIALSCCLFSSFLLNSPGTLLLCFPVTIPHNYFGFLLLQTFVGRTRGRTLGYANWKRVHGEAKITKKEDLESDLPRSLPSQRLASGERCDRNARRQPK